MTTDASAQQPALKFGTFLGVFTPSVLTILGLIMYLRFGWVVGNLGLPVTLLVVLLASSITFITALSASAVATSIVGVDISVLHLEWTAPPLISVTGPGDHVFFALDMGINRFSDPVFRYNPLALPGAVI